MDSYKYYNKNGDPSNLDYASDNDAGYIQN
jgi:hypothetical protein